MGKERMMDTKQAAEAMNGNEYLKEGDVDFFKAMAESNLVAVYGASDDIMIFNGVIHDEFYDDTIVGVKGVEENPCDNDDCPNFRPSGGQVVSMKWCEEPGISWTYETKIPHETFEIMEDGEVYCRGIVFSLDDIQ